MKRLATAFGIFILLPSLYLHAQPARRMVVQAAQRGPAVPAHLWGVFFEDINLGADGGLYAELIKNRSFEFMKPLMGWKVQQKPFREGAVMVINQRHEQPANPRFVRVQLPASPKDTLALANEGFRGMGIKKGNTYHFSMLYRLMPGSQASIQVQLLQGGSQSIGSVPSVPLQPAATWSRVEFSLEAHATEAQASFIMYFAGSGQVDIDMVSLFPADTWKQRKGGLRADMVQLLADLQPGFLRFPGGCIVEGHDLSNRYQWKKTIGPVEQREMIVNRWNFEFGHRPTPDYFQSFGLGFFEYFQLAEDLGAAPLPILNCGMACQYNSAEVVPMDQLDPYIQDALDLIEFANGDTTTTWGKKRADMGHSAPFHLKYIGVGNENWGPQYLERFDAIQQAIAQKYPHMQVIGSSGTDPSGDRFDLLNKHLRAASVSLIDEHFYRKPSWFLENAHRYDAYPRNGSKVFAGEYAGHDERINQGGPAKSTWRAAMAEAAFLTGVERNADVVELASYAPLFAHVDGWQWSPNLIWVNNLQSFGTASYHVQKLFSNHKGTHIVPLQYNGHVAAGQDSLYASALADTTTGEIIIKLVNAKNLPDVIEIVLPPKLLHSAKKARLWCMASPDDLLYNSLENPFAIAPAEKELPLGKSGLTYKAPAYSVSIIRVPLR